MLFGIAFGLVEAVVVLYLQKVIGNPVSFVDYKNIRVLLNLKAIAFISTKYPILKTAQLTSIETIREFATIIMLLAVGIMSGNSTKQKIGAFLVAFGIWDIFYYVFLKFFTGWPKSLLDIDVFFLIPMPWIGPVITPIIVSSVLVIIGSILFNS